MKKWNNDSSTIWVYFAEPAIANDVQLADRSVAAPILFGGRVREQGQIGSCHILVNRNSVPRQSLPHWSSSARHETEKRRDARRMDERTVGQALDASRRNITSVNAVKLPH